MPNLPCYHDKTIVTILFRPYYCNHFKRIPWKSISQ